MQDTASNAATSAQNTASDLASSAQDKTANAADSTQQSFQQVADSTRSTVHDQAQAVPSAHEVKSTAHSYLQQAADVVSSYLPESLGGHPHQSSTTSPSDTHSTSVTSTSVPAHHTTFEEARLMHEANVPVATGSIPTVYGSDALSGRPSSGVVGFDSTRSNVVGGDVTREYSLVTLSDYLAISRLRCLTPAARSPIGWICSVVRYCFAPDWIERRLDWIYPCGRFIVVD